ncbi:MAG TPA: ABC-type transport auxiliary lipoprotein family protein [Roseiarcus sp.]|nr:ABC-type transport auxiliary lipoprotein family protein [Roseiarcus sp.]
MFGPVGRARRLVAAALALPLVLGLAACGGGASLPSFDLSATSAPSERPLRASLIVRQPLSPLAFDSRRIVVRTGPDALAYLADAQWSDRLPVLVQSRLAETFQNAHLFRSVERASKPADYALELEIRHFEIDAPSRAGIVEIAAKIVSGRDGRIIAAQSFKQVEPAASVSGAQAAAALDKALSAVMARIVAFTAAKL